MDVRSIDRLKRSGEHITVVCRERDLCHVVVETIAHLCLQCGEQPM